MLRVVNRQTVPSLVRIPVNGGSYTPLVNFPANTMNTINAGTLGWKWSAPRPIPSSGCRP